MAADEPTPVADPSLAEISKRLRAKMQASQEQRERAFRTRLQLLEEEFEVAVVGIPETQPTALHRSVTEVRIAAVCFEKIGRQPAPPAPPQDDTHDSVREAG